MPEQARRLVASPGRYVLVNVLPLSLVVGLTTGLGWLGAGLAERVLSMAGVAFSACFVGALVGGSWRMGNAWIALRDGVVDGPGAGTRRIVAPIEDIDRVRSNRRSAFQRLVGEQIVWMTSGDRMVLNHHWYRPGELERLLDSVGVGGVRT